MEAAQNASFAGAYLPMAFPTRDGQASNGIKMNQINEVIAKG
jgi:hypothetical protein